jgi:hypothetical protein
MAKFDETNKPVQPDGERRERPGRPDTSGRGRQAPERQSEDDDREQPLGGGTKSDDEQRKD